MGVKGAEDPSSRGWIAPLYFKYKNDRYTINA
uniref:Uncharacterized protein n=1 Tax=Saccharolobus solfataricus (strain 98/2) TaxID=555311 RepID=D0KNE3_SACS9